MWFVQNTFHDGAHPRGPRPDLLDYDFRFGCWRQFPLGRQTMNHSIGAMSIMRFSIPLDIHKQPSNTIGDKSREIIFYLKLNFSQEPPFQYVLYKDESNV